MTEQELVQIRATTIRGQDKISNQDNLINHNHNSLYADKNQVLSTPREASKVRAQKSTHTVSKAKTNLRKVMYTVKNTRNVKSMTMEV